MDWAGRLAESLLKPKVVHSLPGRVRIRVPLLSRAGQVSVEASDLASSLLAELDGIDTVEYNFISGKVLIRYNAALLNEAQVLDFVRTLARVFVRNRNLLLRLDAESLAAAMPKLRPLVRDLLTGANPSLEIPEDVLA